tara:strand:+ start:35177 stop:35734 length:558 start_codon:yes stop_codon:yes gene_type:complete
VNIIFSPSFYFKYRAPNAEELIGALEHYTEQDIDNSGFKWGKQCTIDRIPLEREDYHNMLEPSLMLLSKEVNLNFKYLMHAPWLNYYKRGSFQEIHGHEGNDMSCVFFANSGIGFSEFFFFDRNSVSLSIPMKSLVNYHNISKVEYEAGDILFFPSHMLHGVTPHKSDIVRKTFSVNFNLNIARA